MANTSTKFQDIQVGGQHTGPIHQYSVTIDTPNSDLTIYTHTATANRIWVVGLAFSEGTAANLTFKSGSNPFPVIELAANQGKWDPVTPGSFYLVTEPGKDLIMSSSANITGMTIYLVDGVYLE